jgi:hypothetical protein
MYPNLISTEYLKGEITEFKLCKSRCSKRPVYYTNVPYITEIPFIENEFLPVDVFLDRKGFKVLGRYPQPLNMITDPSQLSLTSKYSNLPMTLKQICGHVNFPPDEGHALCEEINLLGNLLFGACDALFKGDKASHAWILTSGKITDLENELYQIYGSGPVDGVHSNMSLTRAELAGLTAISIVASLLLTKTSAKTKVKIICGNKGAIQACSKPTRDNLRFHRRPNTDLIPPKNQ